MSRDLMLRAIEAEPDRRAAMLELVATWQCFARDDQLLPPGHGTKVYRASARGTGKNRSAAETLLDLGEQWGSQLTGFLAGRNAADTRDSMVNGVSGMRACALRRGYQLDWRPGSNTLVHPAGGQWLVASGEVPDAPRGKNLNAAWVDEIGFWHNPGEGLSNIELALRADAPSPGRLLLITSTPNRRAPISFTLAAEPGITRCTVVPTSANRFLDEGFVAELEAKYGGTSLGRQEVEGQLIATDGVVVALDVIARNRLRHAPETDERRRTVVAWDPGGARSDSDEHGIVVTCEDRTGHHYVLADLSIGGRETREIAMLVVEAAMRHAAGTIVFESNLGGDAHHSLLKSAAETLGARGLRLEGVHAHKSKLDRAEPVALLYEQGRVHHVGIFPELESQLTQWVPPGKSPDRLDALVHAIAWLESEEHVGSLWGRYDADGPTATGPGAASTLAASVSLGPTREQVARTMRLADELLDEARRRLGGPA